MGSKQNIIKILLFIFLFLQVVPLLNRENMQRIIILDYSIVLSIIFLTSLKMPNWSNTFKYFSMTGLIILTFLLYVFGFSGSISGYVLCASLPYFIFNNIHTYERILEVFYNPVKWASVLLIVFGAILFYSLKDQLRNFDLLNKYFIKASINYVSLLFYGFSMLYLLLYEIKKKTSNNLPRIDFIIGTILLGSSIFYSAMYLTRSTFIASVFLLIVFLRQYKFFIVLLILLLVIQFKDSIIGNLITFLGSDDIGSLATQDIRMESILFLISNSTSFNYDFTNTMSTSSLFNLLFCLYPFTLLFIVDIVHSGFRLMRIGNIHMRLFYFTLFTIALFISIYQMDFLSVFVLFMVIQIIIFENRMKFNMKVTDRARS